MGDTTITKLTETEALAAALKGSHEPVVLRVDRGTSEAIPLLLVPQGMEVQDVKDLLDQYLVAPERRKGIARLTDIGSFIEHVNRHKDPDSVVFASTDVGSPGLTGVLDYHRAGPEAGARWGEHRATYAFPLSDEWKAWTARHEKPMGQLDFAQFIEDRILDVAEPGQASPGVLEMVAKLGCDLAGPSTLLALSKGLAVRVNNRVAEARNLSTGECQLSYESHHEDEQGSPLKVPGAFLLAIPVFRGSVPFGLPVRLRYRVKDGTIAWHVSLYRTDVALSTSISEAVERVRKETGLPVLLGSPEQ